MSTHNPFEISTLTSIGSPFGSVERLRNQLLPIVAHELKRPLDTLLTVLETGNEIEDEIAAEEMREFCRREALNMSRIIDDVLDVYCDANGRLRLNLIWVNLASIVQDALEASRPGIVSRGHRISLSLPPGSVSFAADPALVKLILTNLLSNAAKYTAPSGHIYLSADASSEVVTVRVRDNGRGVRPELLPHIFDPNEQQVEARQGGLGLGLSLVKSLAELHGGSVVAQSMGLNEGAEFSVNLPTRGPDVDAQMESFA